MDKKIKILVADDSAFMRKALSRIIQSDEGLEVIATARDGEEVLSLLKTLQPDIITLDVEMPKMNGYETLLEIRKQSVLPVVMVSSITKAGSDIAIRCLEAGAFDIVSKPDSYVSMNISDIAYDLNSKLKAAVHADQPGMSHSENSTLIQNVEVLLTGKKYDTTITSKRQRVITIGSSTGGPMALNGFMSQIPSNLPASIVIVQHMPAGNFIHSLAERLNSQSPFEVRVAENGDQLENGLALIAATGKHITFYKDGDCIKVRLSSIPAETLHCPSVDVLFESAGKIIGRDNISCILTGMGADGAKGLEFVYKNQGHVIAQSENSCVVYGMPRSAVEAGWVHDIVCLEEIPNRLMRQINSGY